MASEIWTATCKEQDDKDREVITFDVLDTGTGMTRQEHRPTASLPLMFALGGDPPVMGTMAAMQDLPWRFRKVDDSIYLDGPIVGVPEYHPIAQKEAQ